MFLSLILFLSLFLTPHTAFGFDLWEDEIVAPKNEIQALPIVLKTNIEVSREHVRLGDIFSGLNEEQDKTVIAPSPALGKSAVLTSEWLQEIAKKNKLDWKDEEKNASVNLKRLSDKITKEEVETFLMDILSKKDIPQNAALLIRNEGLPILIPLNAQWELKEQNAQYDTLYQTFKAEVDLYLEGKKKETLLFSGKVEVFVEIPVARHNLSSGQIIRKEDLYMKSVLQGVGRRKIEVTLPEDLIGKELKRSIRETLPMTDKDVRDQVMVSKGKTITLNFSKGGILLSAQGKALESGGLGDSVRVMNTQSKSVVQGTVTGPETVSIQSFNDIK